MTLEALTAALADRYRVERELGQGGMATVYLAEDLKHQRQVAIKVMRPELSAAIGGDRFVREIGVLARLQHPHILPLLDSSLDQSCLYYVTPFVRGETLRELIGREGSMAIEQVTALGAEIADALAYAHREGIVHRDIKPENILLQEGHAVVADFGVARALAVAGGESLTQAGFAVGTPTYMSPEQATGASEVGDRADVYALGCVLYEMLTGGPPFRGATLQQVAAAHVTTPAPPVAAARSDVPAGLAVLVADCLAKDPADRPSAADLVRRLREGGGSGRSGATSRRWVPAATLAGVLLAAGAWWGSSRGGASVTTLATGSEMIAVMPLSAVSDTSLSRLGQDLVVTLSTTLDGVGELRTVDAATLILNTRDAPSPLPLAEARRIATELGAGSVVTGTLIAEGDLVRATLTLHEVGGEVPVARATALAAPTAIAAMNDSLTWQLLRGVWRGGDAPSPLLSGLTTGSFDALRAFLDAERHFGRIEVDEALADYTRATELDSTFVQAYLRQDMLLNWALRDRDKRVHERLLALADRLPERDRLWLEARESRAPLPEQVARWQELMERYPDYPPILMAGVDPVIHNGPVYGIALEEIRAPLERLVRLTPDHTDTRMHVAFVEGLVGTPEAARDAYLQATGNVDGLWKASFSWEAELWRQRISPDHVPDPAVAIELARSFEEGGAGTPFEGFVGLLGWTTGHAEERLAVVRQAQRDGTFSPATTRRSRLGEGLLLISRGDWSAGLEALAAHAAAGAPDAARLSHARLAAIGAWLGTVQPARARAAVESARAFELGEAWAAELAWMDGLVAIAERDWARTAVATAELERSGASTAAHAARSLAGLAALARGVPAAADSLRALTDAAMRGGGFTLAVEVVNRFAIARDLRGRGQPEAVERYLMWIDAGFNAPQTIGLQVALNAPVRFERGMALEEAGRHEAAVYQFTRFLADYDQPPAEHRAMLDRARQVVEGVPVMPGDSVTVLPLPLGDAP